MSVIIFRVNKMASVGAAIWLPDTETFFVELGTIISRAQQQRNISDEGLDSHIRHILRTTPRSGRRFVQGGLRNRGLRIQRRRVEESMRRVDPVICTLRAARHIIRRVYSVPSPNALF